MSNSKLKSRFCNACMLIPIQGSNTKARGKMGRPAKKKGLRGGVPKRKELATIGRRVKVYWPLEKQWFSGKVDRVLKKGRKAHVVYDDEDTGYLYLSDDGFQWLDEGEAGKPRWLFLGRTQPYSFFFNIS